MRGGGVVQGFAGTIFSTVGAGSMAAYSSVSSGWANGLRNGRQRSEDGHNSNDLRESSRRKGFEPLPLASDIFSSDDCFETGRKRLAGASVALEDGKPERDDYPSWGPARLTQEPV